MDTAHHTSMVIGVEGSSSGEWAEENLFDTWQEFGILLVMFNVWLGQVLLARWNNSDWPTPI